MTFEIIYRPRVLSLGIDLGSNYTINGRVNNFFIELSILFWSFSVEFILDRE